MNVSARRPRADPAIGLYPGDARGPTCGSRRQLPGAYNDFEPVLFLRSGTRPDGWRFPRRRPGHASNASRSESQVADRADVRYGARVRRTSLPATRYADANHDGHRPRIDPRSDAGLDRALRRRDFGRASEV